MSTLELKELIPVNTPLGKGYCFIIEQRNHDVYWKVILTEGCGLVDFRQEKIRVCRSYTHERGITDKQMRKIVK